MQFMTTNAAFTIGQSASPSPLSYYSAYLIKLAPSPLWRQDGKKNYISLFLEVKATSLIF